MLSIILLLSFTGCDLFNEDGDDDDDSTYNPTLADELFEQGNTLLENTLYLNIHQNYGSDYPDIEELVLTEVRNAYTAALSYDSEHSGANMALGIIDLVMLSREERFNSFLEQFDDYEALNSLFGDDSDPLIEPDLSGQIGSLMRAPIEFTKQLVNLDGRSISTSYEIQEDIRDYILPHVDLAIQHFRITWEDTDFEFIITPRMQGNENLDNIEIDRTDISAVLTVLYSLKAILHHSIAYDLELGEMDAEALNNALRPGSNFLTLLAGGTADMVNAHSAWKSSVYFLEASLNLLEAETDYQFDDLIFIDPYDFTLQQDINNLQQEIPRINDLLVSQAEIDFDLDGDGYEEETIAVSLHAFYNNPIEDWKAMLPGYSISLEEYDGGIYGYLEWEANSIDEWIFPDPTFNNLFPGMTNTRIIQLLLDEEGWTKYIDLD